MRSDAWIKQAATSRRRLLAGPSRCPTRAEIELVYAGRRSARPQPALGRGDEAWNPPSRKPCPSNDALRIDLRGGIVSPHPTLTAATSAPGLRHPLRRPVRRRRRVALSRKTLAQFDPTGLDASLADFMKLAEEMARGPRGSLSAEERTARQHVPHEASHRRAAGSDCPASEAPLEGGGIAPVPAIMRPLRPFSSL